MAFMFGLGSFGSGLMEGLSEADKRRMNLLKEQEEQTAIEIQKNTGEILRNNPEIAAAVAAGGMGFGGVGGLGGGFGMPGIGQPQAQQSQQPMTPQPGQPSVAQPQIQSAPIGPPPQQVAQATDRMIIPQQSLPPPPSQDSRRSAEQDAPWTQIGREALRDAVLPRQPWLGPMGRPVGPAGSPAGVLANVDRNAPQPVPPGQDPNAPIVPRPVPTERATAPMGPVGGQQPPPQQQAAAQQAGQQQGAGFPGRGIDLQSAIQRMLQKDPKMKPEVLFGTLTALQKALNPEARMQLQFLNYMLARERGQRDEERLGLQRQRYTSGLFDPETVHMMAQQALSGDKSVFANLGRGVAGPQNIVQVREEMNRLMRERGFSGSDIAAANANFAAQSKAAGTAAVREANIASAIAELDNTIPILEETSKNLPRGTVVPWNQLTQMIQKGTSNPKLAQFVTSLQAVRTAYSMAMNRGASINTVDSMKRADEILGQATSHESLMAQIDILKREAAAARDAPEYVRKQILGRISGRGSQDQPLGGGGARQAPAGGSGDQTKVIDGKTYYQRNGKWYDTPE